MEVLQQCQPQDVSEDLTSHDPQNLHAPTATPPHNSSDQDSHVHNDSEIGANIPSNSNLELVSTETQDQTEGTPGTSVVFHLPIAENMSIASDDIVIDSPTSSLSIASVPSGVESEVSSCRSPISSRISERRKKMGKIRTRNEKDWKDLKRKALKNAGKKHTTRKGAEIIEKVMRDPCNCMKKCAEKITHEEKESIFKKFWTIADHERQWEFIAKCITESKPKRIKASGPNRSRTNVYRLPIDPKDPMVVCRLMFLNTLSISEKMIRTVLNKQSNRSDEGNDENQNPFKITDMRGRHNNRPHKLPDSVHNSVKDHINSLTPIESHYCRKSTSKKYLDGHLSYTRLHQEYLIWYDTEKYGNQKATFRQYSDIVNTNFNIGFHSPKKDQCDKCHTYANLLIPTEDQERDHKIHLALKDAARAIKDLDKAASQNDPSIITACFDMQKVLNCPHGEVSVFYYKRRLNIYNLTVFDMANKLGFCYMWDETIGKKGANEIGSALFRFMRSNILAEGVKHFRFWSDNCSGQNRNRIIFALYQYIIDHYNIESITHRFLEVGHTQNEGDSVHSVIERASHKGRVIYTPQQWFNLIRWAKTSGDPYRVTELTQDDILDLRTLLDGRNWLKNDDGEKVMWNKIKEIYVKKEMPDTIHYKYDLSCEEYKIIKTAKKTRSKKKIVTSEIKKAHTSLLKLNYDKYKDLVGMCESKVIPEEFANLFKDLPHYERNAINTYETDDDE
ncbi:uncharacterized protein [Choristoneura fumiferana]|uniref:uncharacterized protein n=1 Tax=Choristoneura fumiferana TaxID=7141 RepID=UPI003D1582DD